MSIIAKKANPAEIDTPTTGKVSLYVDCNDGKIKIKDDSGCVNTLVYKDEFNSPAYIDVLVVGGGGAGAAGNGGLAGGGGGGGVVFYPHYIIDCNSINVVVGGVGGTSCFGTNIRSYGGTNGKDYCTALSTCYLGGCGGGTYCDGVTRGGTTGAEYGGSHAGGDGGGGARANGYSGIAWNCCNGWGGIGGMGYGTTFGVIGTGYKYYGSGGGGGGLYTNSGATPVTPGGGCGMAGCRQAGGKASECGGGGGAGGYNGAGGAGTCGIVIVAYKTDGSNGIISATGGTICCYNGCTIHCFVSNGTFCITCSQPFNPMN